jgi:hypothetical protein
MHEEAIRLMGQLGLIAMVAWIGAKAVRKEHLVKPMSTANVGQVVAGMGNKWAASVAQAAVADDNVSTFGYSQAVL